jgi:hypothetical protein
MKDTPLYIAAEKILPPHLDVEHYFQALLSFPENKWFHPTNQETNFYSICMELAAFGLIAQIRTPIWIQGSFRGYRIEFYYNTKLYYIPLEK